MLLAGYFLSVDNLEVTGFKDDLISYEPIIVKGNSYSIQDDYIDPLDYEISKLDYNDIIESGDRDFLCYEDLECGEDYIEDSYCIGKKVYQKVHTFTCDGRCDEDVDRELKEECLIGCFEGGCVDSYKFDCINDFDCGFNDFVGKTYCISDNVHQYYANWTCLDPGTENSSCKVELEDKLVDLCGDGLSCSAGYCIDDS